MKTITLYTETKKTLLELLYGKAALLDAPCGGKGTCGKCRVKASGELSPLSPAEKKHLSEKEISDGIRLACETFCSGNAEVTVFEGEMTVETSAKKAAFTLHPAADLSLSSDPCGMAVDIGTTTVAAFFYDLLTGEHLYTAGGVNSQRTYGADVLSRIDYITKNQEGLKTLQREVSLLLSSFIERFTAEAGRKNTDIIDITVAGNSTMELIFAGIDVTSLGYAPYTPGSLLGFSIPAKEVGLSVHDKAEVYFLPLVSGFIGGDTVAAMLSLDFDKTDKCEFLVDIGTNGEMAVTENGRVYACSTAAGPAFEGAKIKFGTASVKGAVTKVKITDGSAVTTTIGNASPVGICGSGLISLTAELVNGELLDETGVFQDDSGDFGTEDGETVFYLTKDKSIYLTQKDVREVQLAKSAIAAGSLSLTKVLTNAKKLPEKAYIAGGFGMALDLSDAGAIGLLPNGILAVAEKTGNSAGEGAVLCLLSKEDRMRAELLSKRVEIVELTGDSFFQDQFVENMFF